MSSQCEALGKKAAGAPLGFFERYLTLWVFLCIVAGTLLGLGLPAVAHAIGALEIAHVNIPVGLLIWVMIIPMLMKIDFSALREVYAQRTSMGITLFVNWAIKPFTMALLGWLFIKHVFAPWLPATELDSYMAGLILLGAAPCTAMVFVWSNLCSGNANFTLTQVALNDVVMVFAFAPIVALLLGVSSIPVPWDTLLLSVVMYIVIPLAIAQFIRARLMKRGERAFQTHWRRFRHSPSSPCWRPWSCCSPSKAKPSSPSR
ncbi:putative sodium bile acid symporter family protein [Pseudomonas sp. BAY1663]|nr:putative sodium bile acid symporter family protein [Pseudomonas sp. BAY1663]